MSAWFLQQASKEQQEINRTTHGGQIILVLTLEVQSYRTSLEDLYHYGEFGNKSKQILEIDLTP